MGLERSFLSAEGLPGRPWFRHLLFAPGLTTGYGAWPFPELAEAVESKDADLFARGASRVVEALERVTGEMERTTQLTRSQDGWESSGSP